MRGGLRHQKGMVGFAQVFGREDVEAIHAYVIKRAHEDAERADFDSFKASQGSSGSMGTFGDLLKKKLGG